MPITVNDHTPRSAAVLLSAALGHLDVVEPPAAREPIRSMFRAGIERCALSTSLAGLPMRYELDLAQAIVDMSREGSGEVLDG
jgi:hypothetical protein